MYFINNKARAVMLMAMLMVAKAAEIGENPRTRSDCRKYEKDYLISACASSLREAGLISKLVFNQLLDHAKERGSNPGSTYWSLGIATGRATRLIAAKQVDPTFVSQLSVSLDPRDVYHEALYYDNLAAVEKPVLIYLTKAIEGVPPLKENMLAQTHTPGNPKSGLRVYRSGAISVMKSREEGCGKFGKWDYLQSAKQMLGAAIIMPGDMWCPSAARDSFTIMYGEYDVFTAEGDQSRYMVPIKQLSTDKTHNINMPENEQDF